MRLIDADALVIPKYEECNNPFIDGFHQGKVDAIVEARSLAPTVDAVEVVRCKDCTEYGMCPIYYFHLKSPNGFCSNGKRKEGSKTDGKDEE